MGRSKCHAVIYHSLGIIQHKKIFRLRLKMTKIKHTNIFLPGAKRAVELFQYTCPSFTGASYFFSETVNKVSIYLATNERWCVHPS